MAGPIVFISHNRVRPGKIDGFRSFFGEGAKAIAGSKPGTVAFLAYADEGGGEVDIVHVFPDADAMDRHLEGVAERAAGALEFVESGGYEIYGSPTEQTLETMRGFASRSGVPLVVRPAHLGGYLRAGAD